MIFHWLLLKSGAAIGERPENTAIIEAHIADGAQDFGESAEMPQALADAMEAARNAILAAQPEPDVSTIIKAECKRRIYAVVSQEAQNNMVIARDDLKSGTTTAETAARNALSLFVTWRNAMQAACKAAIAAKTPLADIKWPPPSAALVAAVKPY